MPDTTRARMKRTIKLQVMMSAEEVQLLEDWRFTHRVPTRSEAIRKLIRAGLTTFAGIDGGTKPTGRLSTE